MKPAVGGLLIVSACVCLGFGLGMRAPAQPAAPAPPANYQVMLRYRIIAPRDQHVVFYDRLIKHLQSLKFEFQPPLDTRPDTDRIDPNKNEFRGRLAAANVPKLRENPHVAGIVLVPEGMDLAKVPPEQALRVRVELVGGLPPDRQRELSDQTKLLLGTLGFQEASGYDHRGAGGQPYTRLMGTLPLAQLPVLLKDLRTQPGGWFAPRIAPAELPAPLRTIDPILYTEVLTEPEPIKDAPEPTPRSPEYLEKIGPGLWEIVSDKEKETQQVRVQVIFAGAPSLMALRQTVQRVAPGGFVEGILGTTITGQMPASQVKALAAIPEVLAIRSPTPPRGSVNPALKGANEPAKVLKLSGLADLHGLGKRGQGVRLAVIDSDFRGWEAQMKKGVLPPATRLVDLTTEQSPDLFPAPQPAGAELGHGTQCALAAAVAAPAAELVLVRIAGDDPFQLVEVNRYLRGGEYSPLLERRLDELRVAASLLNLKRNQLLKERKVILNNFRDEEEIRRDFEFLGAVYGWIFSERTWHQQQMAYQEKRQQEYDAKERRYWKFVEQLQSLKGISLAACAFTWNDGYPLGGASPLARALDAEAGGALWFVPAGNTAGQAWTGSYRDADSNGVMEFVEPGAKLPPGRWTTELNFLAWQPHEGKQTADLPAKTNLHLTLQWREPHDPDYFLRPGEEDWYRRPLFPLRITLLRQRDPDGKKVGADAFDIVARSQAVPGRLDHQPGGAVYELVLDYVVEQPGRYALRVEQPDPTRWTLNKVGERFFFELRPALATHGTRPIGAPTLPGVEKTWELRPRLFADVAGEAALQGRPVLADFATAAGAVGTPGDARSVITVGAAGLDGKPQPYSAAGAPPFIDLAEKPTVWAYDAVRQGQGGAWGTSLSASFAAGTAATLTSTGVMRQQLLEAIHRQEGQMFHVAAPK